MCKKFSAEILTTARGGSQEDVGQHGEANGDDHARNTQRQQHGLVFLFPALHAVVAHQHRKVVADLHTVEELDDLIDRDEEDDEKSCGSHWMKSFELDDHGDEKSYGCISNQIKSSMT